MLQAYRNHVEERAAQGLPPLPLDANQTAALVSLLKSPVGFERWFVTGNSIRQFIGPYYALNNWNDGLGSYGRTVSVGGEHSES